MAGTPAAEKRRELDRGAAAEPRPRRRILSLAVVVLALVLLALSQARGLCGRLPAAARLAASRQGGVAADGGGREPLPSEARPHMPSAKREDASAAVPAARSVVNCFQVAQPVLLPGGATTSDGRVAEGTAPPGSGKACVVELMRHSFGNSYNQPFVGNYVPPDCDFNRVAMNFTVVSQGRQFDRLALMYLGDTEVWRTSTAEPTAPPGIRWVYLKDMTAYLSLWRAPQTVIFDLGNLINDKYTGPFNATLTATFFRAGGDGSQAPPSDLIIPVSARRGAQGAVSQFTLPQDNATNTVRFPRNAARAVFSVSANGQADEEFWWSNVLQADTLTFNKTAGAFPGFSPFREVQVLIDGRLAGVQWPFPVIFTGGVVPSLHRPVAGIDVFDLREHEIDITPWLPLLCDGAAHTFTILVAGIDGGDGSGPAAAALTRTVGSSWYVTGKIFVWLDGTPGAVTTGTPPTVSGELPSVRVSRALTANATGANETLEYTATVSRSFAVTATVVTASGGSRAVSWSQSLSYSNNGRVAAFGEVQINDMDVRGADSASGGSGGVPGYGSDAATTNPYRAEYAFPLFCNTTTSVSPQGNLTLWARLRQGLRLQVSGPAVHPTGLEAFAARRRFAGGALLSTQVEGTASFFQTGDGRNSSGFGTANQVFRFGGLSPAGALGSGPDVELYARDVTAANDTVVADREVLAGRATVGFSAAAPPTAGLFAQAPSVGGGSGPRVFMGRGGSDPSTADDIPVMFQVAMGG